jgi:hypothetical protein
MQFQAFLLTTLTRVVTQNADATQSELSGDTDKSRREDANSYHLSTSLHLQTTRNKGAKLANDVHGIHNFCRLDSQFWPMLMYVLQNWLFQTPPMLQHAKIGLRLRGRYSGERLYCLVSTRHLALRYFAYQHGYK